MAETDGKRKRAIGEAVRYPRIALEMMPRDDAYRPLKLVPRERNIDLNDPLWGLTLTPRRPTLRDITRELIGGESLGGTWTLELSHCWHVAE